MIHDLAGWVLRGLLGLLLASVVFAAPPTGSSADKQKEIQERMAAQKQKELQDRIAAQKQREVQERIAAQKQREIQERIAAQKQREIQERIAAQKQREIQERIAAQKQKEVQERIAAQKQREIQNRIAAQKQKEVQERIAAQKQKEVQERIAAQKQKEVQERIAAQKQKEVQERIAAQKQKEVQERIAAQKQKEVQERIAAQKQKEVQERIAAQKQKEVQERIAAQKQKEVQERIAAQKQKEVQERIAAQKQKEVQERIAAQKQKEVQERIAAQKQKEVQERIAAQKQKEVQERIAAQKQKEVVKREQERRISKLNADQKRQLSDLSERMKKSQQQTVKPKKDDKPNIKKQPVSPGPNAKTSLTQDNKDALGKVAKGSPALDTAIQKVTDPKKGPLTKDELKQLSGAAKDTSDPKTKVALQKLTYKDAYLTDNSLQQIAKLSQDQSLTENERAVLKKVLHNEPLSSEDQTLLKNMIDLPGLKSQPAAVAALSSAIREVQDKQQRGDFLNALQNTLQSLVSGSGQVPAGGLVIPGDNGPPAIEPSLWIPNDPSVSPGDAVLPSGSGTAVTVIPGPADPNCLLQGGSEPTDPATDPLVQLGAVAADTTQRFDRRYLRLSNASDETVKVWIQYRTRVGDGPEQWFPAEPKDSDEALAVELEPGESVDLKDNDWAVNASDVRYWAKSATREWSQFKSKDLPLVPEPDGSGSRGYDAQYMQTFCLTLR